MDADRFDRLVVALTDRASRRSVLALASALGATALVAEEARAICLVNGERCDPDTSHLCCSGKCPRKKKRCRAAPGQGTCTTEKSFCENTSDVCGATGNCLCFITTNGQSYCGATNSLFACTTDRQCVREFGKGSRCVESGGTCNGGDPTPVCAIKCTDL